PLFLAVIDTQGQTIASVGMHPIPPSTPFQVHLSPQDHMSLHAALNDRKGTTSIASQEADGTLLALTPIIGNGGNIQGELVMKIAQQDKLPQFAGFFQVIIVTVTVVTIIAAIAGMI